MDFGGVEARRCAPGKWRCAFFAADLECFQADEKIHGVNSRLAVIEGGLWIEGNNELSTKGG